MGRSIRVSPFLLVVLTLAPSLAVTRPVLPFLFDERKGRRRSIAPVTPTSTQTASPSTSSTSTSTSSSSSTPEPSSSSSSSTDKLPVRLAQADDGSYEPRCWKLHGQTNCPQNATSTDTSTSTLQNDEAFAVNATSTSTVPSASASPSETVKPYPMAFTVTNIPPGWQKSQRTQFYSRPVVIGLSVTLAALIVFTIVGCVIWRVRVSRERKREKIRKEEGVGEVDDSGYESEERGREVEEKEKGRRKGLRRRGKFRWRRRKTVFVREEPTTTRMEVKPEDVPLPVSPTPSIAPPSVVPSQAPSPPEQEQELHPPAYRRRPSNPLSRLRPSTPSDIKSPTFDAVPEEYMYLRGLPPTSIPAASPSPSSHSTPLAFLPEPEEEGEDEETLHRARLAVSAHLAIDDKSALRHLETLTSSAPTPDEPGPSASVPLWSEEEEYEEEHELPMDVKRPVEEGLGLPAPPSLTPAHLFVPMHVEMELRPSAPPPEDDSPDQDSHSHLPSAPPLPSYEP